ncbi:MAG: hypothetical protein ACLRXB_06590 [Escherichia coli]
MKNWRVFAARVGYDNGEDYDVRCVAAPVFNANNCLPLRFRWSVPAKPMKNTVIIWRAGHCLCQGYFTFVGMEKSL